MKSPVRQKLAAIISILALLLCMGGEFTVLYGQLRTTATISPGMVVQRQVDIPIWGEAQAGTLVSAEMNGSSAFATAGGNGKWELQLPAMEAGGPYELIIWSANDTLQLQDIYVGDVWLASGQSNMAMRLDQTSNASAVIAASENPLVRQYLVARSLGNEPRDQPPAGSEWMHADPEHSGVFSAVGYYFAKHLHENLEIPIGIINSSYGGTRIESWMSKEMLGYDEQDISLGENSFNQPTVTYNTMLHPLIHTPLKGVIWYQGESNMGNRENALMYTGQMRKLITSWRELWGNEELPFIWVQLPNIGTEANESTPGTWDALPMLRAAQSRTLSLSNTGEAVAIDLGEIDIHPVEKEEVGRRLSLAARKLVYSDPIVSSGPRYKSHRKMGGGRIEVSFDHVGEGLVAKETGDQSLRWFALAGSNGTFHKANALIVGDKVELWNPGVPDPVSMRYAWEHNPYNTNFYNSEDLPARPFKVRIDHPGFKLQSYKALTYHLDKGESTLLTWEWSGAKDLTINGIPVDSIGGWRIWPENDSTFTLRASDRENRAHTDSATVTITVQQPDPTIDIFANRGEWMNTGSELSLRARVSAPLGGTVTLVEFFANDERIASLSQEPFEFSWTPAAKGSYDIYGVATSQAGMSTRSDSIHKLVDEFAFLHLEAEDADLKGGKWFRDDDSVSGGQYVELTRDWTIAFPDFHLDSSQTCQLSLFSLLNFGSPKMQHFLVNGESYPDLIFEAPNETSWVGEHLLIPLDSGVNTISLKANWGYISLDCMELLYRPSQAAVDSTTSAQSRTARYDVFMYPNPSTEVTHINYHLPANGDVNMELYDMTGRKIAVLLNGKMEAGQHQLEFHREGLENGTYILRMNFEGNIYRDKLILQ